MVIMNNGKDEKKIDTKRYSENLQGFRKGKDALDGKQLRDLNTIEVGSKSVKIIELTK
jgi:hypothetical protein